MEHISLLITGPKCHTIIKSTKLVAIILPNFVVHKYYTSFFRQNKIKISLICISSHLTLSHLISSHLTSSHLIIFHLISPHLISSHLISFPHISDVILSHGIPTPQLFALHRITLQSLGKHSVSLGSNY